MNRLEKEIEFGEMFGGYALSAPDVDMTDHWDVSVPATDYEKTLLHLGELHCDQYGVVISKTDIGIDPIKVDVKAQPKGKQSHSYRWVEITNVRGASGWLYGKADIIAFEYDEYWMLVPRRALVRLVESKLQGAVTSKDWSGNPQPFHTHTRTDRADVVTMVPVVDLCWIGDIIKKPSGK